MKLTKLNLTNYRGVEDLDLALHPNLNVFIGVNGAGKSTILDSIAIMLSWVVNRLQNPRAFGRPITEPDIANGKDSSTIQLSSSIQQQVITWQLVRIRQGHITPNRSDLSKLNPYIEQLRQQITLQPEPTNLPLFVYYPVNRAVLDIPLRIKHKHQFNPLIAYKDALTSGANFRTFFEWFREREDLENENFKYRDTVHKPDDFCFPDPQLEAVRQAIYGFLPDFSNLTVRRSPLRMEITKQGQILTVNQLSNGEKCLIAMIGDLARRMAMLNPQQSEPLKGDGIILIDEIDLHLHPQWQRFLIPKMLEVFPNCQFFISTHSPHVITHVQPENLHLLKQTNQGIKIVPALESYGKTVERILEDLMGLETTRPTEVDLALRKIFENIARNRLLEAKEGIKLLKPKIKDDPELTKAEVLIRRKESIGK